MPAVQILRRVQIFRRNVLLEARQDPAETLQELETAKGAPMIYETFIPCVPPTSTNQSQRGLYVGKDGRPHVFIKAKGRRIESDLCSLLHTYRPPEDFPRDKPVRVEITLLFPYRKTEKKSVIREGLEIPHYSRPDLDNLVKFLLDCMTRTGYWTDDGKVYDLHLRKLYAPKTGIVIKLIAGEKIPSIFADLPTTFADFSA